MKSSSHKCILNRLCTRHIYIRIHTHHMPQEGDFDLQKRIANCLTKPKAIKNKYSWLKAQRNSYPHRTIQTSKQKENTIFLNCSTSDMTNLCSYSTGYPTNISIFDRCRMSGFHAIHVIIYHNRSS